MSECECPEFGTAKKRITSVAMELDTATIGDQPTFVNINQDMEKGEFGAEAVGDVAVSECAVYVPVSKTCNDQIQTEISKVTVCKVAVVNDGDKACSGHEQCESGSEVSVSEGVVSRRSEELDESM